jgi:hypothetical protein
MLNDVTRSDTESGKIYFCIGKTQVPGTHCVILILKKLLLYSSTLNTKRQETVAAFTRNGNLSKIIHFPR